MTEDEADAEAVRLTRDNPPDVYFAKERAPGEWEVVKNAPEKVGKLRTFGRALRDGAWG